MAVISGHEPITSFEQWYKDYTPEARNGLTTYGLADCANELWRLWQNYKREMDLRVAGYGVLEKLSDGEVISRKPDLPNVSSGEVAGLVRRISRNLVQNTPNVEVVSCYDDDSVKGIFSRFVLTTKIIGSDNYSNDMQQNLFASTKTAFGLGFAAVIPVLLQRGDGSWYIKYDSIHYRDVFPEPGAKDIRDATSVFVRRYLTLGEVRQLIRTRAAGWDLNALSELAKNRPPARQQESVDHQTKKHHQTPDGYEVVTYYTSTGDPFLTFDANSKLLLRIEKNKHPEHLHPVHFLVLEKDENQPLGKSQIELLVGRQEFQDLMLNGAMKLWYRNINPAIIAYGAANAVPNLGPGKYTQISNPNAKVEAFEVNTQTLMQYGQISQQNLGSMVSTVGAADQQMATQAGNGMSATPQGVEAQQAMVDITTNNYQKAIESFFSHYCSYALTIYFAEMRSVKTVSLSADARMKLLEAGLPVTAIKGTETAEDEEGNEVVKKYGDTLDIDFEDLAKQYWVRCVPGSLTELEDEKQLRILNSLFVPLSQAMPAMAATQDQRMITQAALAMSYIIQKQLELSGSAEAKDLSTIFATGDWKGVSEKDQRIAQLEEQINNTSVEQELEMVQQSGAIHSLQEQMSLMTQNMGILLNKLGVQSEAPESSSATYTPPDVSEPSVEETEPYVSPANA